MNILFIAQLVPDSAIMNCTGYSVAGDTMIKNIVKGLEKCENINVEVLSSLPNNSFPNGKLIVRDLFDQYLSTNVFNVGYVNIPGIKQIIQEVRFCNCIKAKYDIILCFNMYQQFGESALRIQEKNSIPLVSILADFPVERKSVYKGYRSFFFNIIKKKTFKNINKLQHAILLNENAAQFLNKNSDYIVVPGGINEEDYCKNHYSGDRRNIVYAGALTEYSGVKNLIDAVCLINEFEWSLEIYGEGILKEYILSRSKFDARIKYMGVKKHSDMKAILRDSWILINPRSVEDPISQVTFPSKIFEYLLCERPVISTSFSGVPKEIESLYFSCGNGDAIKIKEQILMIYNMPEDELNYFINNSVNELIENYNWSFQCKKISEYLNSIVNEEYVKN